MFLACQHIVFLRDVTGAMLDVQDKKLNIFFCDVTIIRVVLKSLFRYRRITLIQDSAMLRILVYCILFQRGRHMVVVVIFSLSSY